MLVQTSRVGAAEAGELGLYHPARLFALMSKEDPSTIGLPPRPFLYTIDQLSVLTGISEQRLHQQHVYHETRDIGIKDRHHLTARNIARPDKEPDWRVAEKEFIRWMKLKGFKYYDQGTITG